MNRIEALRWLARSAGYRVPPSVVRHWEKVGLLRHQRPGHNHPAEYHEGELVRLRLVAQLRREGEPMRRVRAASRHLAEILPACERGGLCFLVDRLGRLVVDTGTLDDIAPRVPASAWLEEARRAIRTERRVVHG